MISRLRYPLFFLFSLAWFAFFQPWGAFVDPDAFYHAKAAWLIAAQGPLKEFPWLDLTSLYKPFVDQHFLFHVLLVPFENALGMLRGTQVAAVFFAALFITVLFWVIRRLSVRGALFWTVLALFSSSLILRLSLAKASPLALICFVVGLTAIAIRRPWLGFMAGALFALVHGGWPMLLACQILYLLGVFIFDRLVVRSPDFHLRSPVSCFLATGFGVLLGLLIHPNFPNVFSFVWVQAVKIGLGTPFSSDLMAREWQPWSVLELAAGVVLQLGAGLVLLYGLLFARRREFDAEQARRAIAFGLPVAALTALTLKSGRYIEYLVPLLTIWLAGLSAFVDFVRLKAEVAEAWRVMTGKWPKFLRRATGSVIVLVIIGFCARDAWETRQSMARLARPFGMFKPAMAAISAKAKDGERVFNVSWDEFPQLFALDDRLRYVSGLDPAFLAEANRPLADLYRDLTLGRVNKDVAKTIEQQFDSRFVLAEQKNNSKFIGLLRADPLAKVIYLDDKMAAFELSTAGR